MRITLTFHGPFRVATGEARRGVAVTVDDGDLVPASSLKGLMRASASLLLPGRPKLVNAVFGTAWHPSPWHWGPVDFGDPPTKHERARVSLDTKTGAARPHFLLVGEEMWPATGGDGSFDVSRQGFLTHTDIRRHEIVLAVAAAGVHALGSDRRRGLGWVTMVAESPRVDDALLADFERLRSERPDVESDVVASDARPGSAANLRGGDDA